MKALVHFWILLFGLTNPSFSQEPEEGGKGMQHQVVAVFPSPDTLAANLLRLYIHFSTPMKPVGNLEKIQLLDEKGNEVIGAIFNHVYELWNHEQTQLTILLDPSRVKMGLRSHEERGRALVRGKRYQLVIGALEDVKGRRTTPFTKSFMVEAEDVMPPNTDSWVFKMPKAGSKNPLMIKFPQMLDRLSLVQRLRLTDHNSQPVEGRIEIVNGETEWHFHPKDSWIAGQYIMYVHARLEDPSGNNLNGLFDHKPGMLKNEFEGKIETISLTLIK